MSRLHTLNLYQSWNVHVFLLHLLWLNTKDIHISIINPSTLTYEKKISRFFIRYKKLNLLPHPLPVLLLLVLSVLSPDSYFRETLKLPLSLIDIQTINYSGLRLTEKRSMIYGILWCTVMWHEGRQLPQHTDSTWMYKVHSSYTKIPLILFHEKIVAMQF